MKMEIIVHIIQRIHYVFLYLNCSILMNDQKVLKVHCKTFSSFWQTWSLTISLYIRYWVSILYCETLCYGICSAIVNPLSGVQTMDCILHRPLLSISEFQSLVPDCGYWGPGPVSRSAPAQLKMSVRPAGTCSVEIGPSTSWHVLPAIRRREDAKTIRRCGV